MIREEGEKRKEGKKENVQNKSPAPCSAFFSCRSRIVHNQAGYSSSGAATGSCLSFRKLSPLRGCPAGMLLLTSGATFFFAASAAVAFRSGLAAGVKGSLKGCAADVDVAVGGVCDEDESPWRAADCVAVALEMGVALRRGDGVVKKRGFWARRETGGIWWALLLREAARRQDRHIIFFPSISPSGSGVRRERCCSVRLGCWLCFLPRSQSDGVVQKFETTRGGCRGVSPMPVGVRRYGPLVGWSEGSRLPPLTTPACATPREAMSSSLNRSS